ncbi:MAG: hypothetical protein ABJH45_00820 [Paracoccaceae bacterium]
MTKKLIAAKAMSDIVERQNYAVFTMVAAICDVSTCLEITHDGGRIFLVDFACLSLTAADFDFI